MFWERQGVPLYWATVSSDAVPIVSPVPEVRDVGCVKLVPAVLRHFALLSLHRRITPRQRLMRLKVLSVGAGGNQPLRCPSGQVGAGWGRPWALR